MMQSGKEPSSSGGVGDRNGFVSLPVAYEAPFPDLIGSYMDSASFPCSTMIFCSNDEARFGSKEDW